MFIEKEAPVKIGVPLGTEHKFCKFITILTTHLKHELSKQETF